MREVGEIDAATLATELTQALVTTPDSQTVVPDAAASREQAALGAQSLFLAR